MHVARTLRNDWLCSEPLIGPRFYGTDSAQQNSSRLDGLTVMDHLFYLHAGFVGFIRQSQNG